MNKLEEIISNQGFALADGAIGTNLFTKGLMTGDAPELWCVDEVEKVRQLHQEFVDAGSDIILTNSFGGTPYRMKLHNAEGRVDELNIAAAQIARDVADKADRPVIVGGSIGPTGERLGWLVLAQIVASAHLNCLILFLALRKQIVKHQK